jgi:hypothetical protein
LTWDQGPETRDWKQVRVDASIEVYVRDPHTPWQRRSNENSNAPLRQYFPNGTDFATVSESQLDAVADQLNDRPASASTSPTRPSGPPNCCCNDRQNPPIPLRDTVAAAFRHTSERLARGPTTLPLVCGSSRSFTSAERTGVVDDRQGHPGQTHQS